MRLRRHHSFANVMSVMALFVALGGSSYAAVTLSKNSVGPKQIKKDAVRASEIKRNAVGASEIRSGAVASGDVSDGTLLAADFAPGQIPPGPKGDKGDTGTFNPASTTIIARRADFNLPAGPSAGNPGPEVDGFETCEPGEKIIGGSVNTSSPAGATTLISRPATDTIGNGGIPENNAFTAWKGTARTETNAAATMRVFAICASAPAAP